MFVDDLLWSERMFNRFSLIFIFSPHKHHHPPSSTSIVVLSNQPFVLKNYLIFPSIFHSRPRRLSIAVREMAINSLVHRKPKSHARASSNEPSYWECQDQRERPPTEPKCKFSQQRRRIEVITIFLLISIKYCLTLNTRSPSLDCAGIIINARVIYSV